MLFRFALRPLDQVAPWGKAPALSLHWFGLTDGWSWMDVGPVELFRYTPALLSHWSVPSAGPLDCYPDYQVVRLWEDVWDLSSAALEPIPDDVLAARPAAESASRRLWRPDVDRLTDDEVDVLADASGWWDARRLSTLHLRSGPVVRFWRSGDTVHIGWDNRGRTIDGLPVWTATEGTASYPLHEFVGQVRQFHDQLAAAMRPRVAQVVAVGPPAGVDIHLQSLAGTQAGWDAGMGDPLQRRTMTDWDRVRAAISRARRLLARSAP